MDNSALLVTRMLGLKNIDDLIAVKGEISARPWVSAQYHDKAGTLWNQLELKHLVEQEDFLKIGA
jgi:twitching motility protein PilI